VTPLETTRRTALDRWILGSLWIGSACAQQTRPGQPWIPPAAGDDEEDDAAGDDDGDGPAGEDETGGLDTSTGHGGGSELGSEAGGLEDHGELESSTGGGQPDSPYQGGWDIGTCQDSIVATHNGQGGVLDDFSVDDQFGESVRLYDFCHKAILLTDGSFW
jgi:hypothetical protein